MSNQFESDLKNLDKRIAAKQTEATQITKQQATDKALNKTELKELKNNLHQSASENLTPILEKVKAWLENRGTIDLISNEHGDKNGPYGDNWEYAVTIRLTWDTSKDNSQDKNFQGSREQGKIWGNSIAITLGDDHNLTVSRVEHIKTIGPRAPKNFTREDAIEILNSRVPGTHYEPEKSVHDFADRINHKYPNLNDEDWQERIESSIIQMLEEGKEKYSHLPYTGSRFPLSDTSDPSKP